MVARRGAGGKTRRAKVMRMTSSHEPRYRQLKQQLIEQLRRGRWKHGQRIPSEPVLAARHGVAIATVRRAVGELVAEHILERRQGSGTYVLSHTPDYMLGVFFRIAGRDGRKELPTSRLLGLTRARADAATARALQLTPRGSVIRIDMLLSLQGRPVILDRLQLPARLFPGFSAAAFAARTGTVYGFFQQHHGVTVVRAEEYVTAVAATPEAAAWLGVAPGAPLLRIERTAYTYRDRPVDTRVRLVRSDAHGYLGTPGRG